MIPILPYDPTRAGAERWLTPRRADLLDRLWASRDGLTVTQLQFALDRDGMCVAVTSIQCTLERMRAAGLVTRCANDAGVLVYRAAHDRDAFETAQYAAIAHSLDEL